MKGTTIVNKNAQDCYFFVKIVFWILTTKVYKYSPINCEKYHLRHELSWMMLFSKNKGIAKFPFPQGCLAPYSLHNKLCYFILVLYLVIQDIENGGKDMSQTQMLKGILNHCLFTILRKEGYGYEMAERLVSMVLAQSVKVPFALYVSGCSVKDWSYLFGGSQPLVQSGNTLINT